MIRKVLNNYNNLVRQQVSTKKWLYSGLKDNTHRFTITLHKVGLIDWAQGKRISVKINTYVGEMLGG